jgi:hypothetical protein
MHVGDCRLHATVRSPHGRSPRAHQESKQVLAREAMRRPPLCHRGRRPMRERCKRRGCVEEDDFSTCLASRLGGRYCVVALLVPGGAGASFFGDIFAHGSGDREGNEVVDLGVPTADRFARGPWRRTRRVCALGRLLTLLLPLLLLPLLRLLLVLLTCRRMPDIAMLAPPTRRPRTRLKRLWRKVLRRLLGGHALIAGRRRHLRGRRSRRHGRPGDQWAMFSLRFSFFAPPQRVKARHTNGSNGTS